MTAARIGLMGFGRIGRNVFRLLHNRDDMDIVAIADIAKPDALTYLLKYDSIYGRFPAEVVYRDGSLHYGSKEVAFDDSRTPGDTRWGDFDVDIVLDTTSRYRSKNALQGHLESGASNVVLTSSPETPGEIPLVIRSINDSILDDAPEMVALGSNTSNAAAPILRILNEAFGLERVFMTVVKAMSNAGRLADVPTDSYRTSRAAGENIIPAETNSAEIITQVMPELTDKIWSSPSACRCLTAPPSTWSPRPHDRDRERGERGRGLPSRRPVQRRDRVRGRPDRVLGRPARLLLRRIRQPGDDGHRWEPGEDHHVVQQRLGLLGPQWRS